MVNGVENFKEIRG